LTLVIALASISAIEYRMLSAQKTTTTTSISSSTESKTPTVTSTSNITSATSSTPSIGQLKVLSVRLENMSIGADLLINVTFVNQGGSDIYYSDPGILNLVSISCDSTAALSSSSVTTTTVTVGQQATATTTTMSNATATTSSACASPPPVTAYQVTQTSDPLACDIFSTESAAPGAARSVYWSPCDADGTTTHYRITSSGTFQVVLAVTWGLNQYPANNLYVIDVVQDFTVG
jgi:hypothetical protein